MCSTKRTGGLTSVRFTAYVLQRYWSPTYSRLVVTAFMTANRPGGPDLAAGSRADAPLS